MPPNKSKFHFDQGLNFFQRGEYKKASTYFKEAVLEDPQFHEALYNLACCLAMEDDKDNALVYLARAVKLNMSIMDWAKEDREFDKIRNDPIFQRIITGDTSETQAAVEIDEELDEENFDEAEFEESVFEKIDSENIPVGAGSSDPPPNFSDPKEKRENLPPCAKCGGLLYSEKRTKRDPKVLMIMLFVGFAAIFFIYISYLGLLGVPVIALALYYFTQVHRIWICNSCGAVGLECGQPPETMEIQRAETTNDLNSQAN